MNLRIQIPALHAGQQRIASEAKRFNVLECGRRFGKSTFGQNQATLTAIDGGPVGWFAPTYKILAPMWREIERIVDPLVARKDKQEKYMQLVTGGVLEFWSLDDPNAGRSRKYKRVVIDEASLVRDLQDAWENSIRPTLADLQGDAWFFFTPKGHNYAHQLFAKGQDPADAEWKSWRFGSADNPFIAAEEIEAARRSLPTVAFEQEWLGIPAPDGGNPFGIDAIRACIAPVSNAAPVVYGWDLGRAEDFTVGVPLDMNGVVCRPIDRWHKRPWPETRRSIRHITGYTPALVDSTGLGDVVLQELQEGASNFEGYVFSRPSKQQLMAGLASAIQQQMVRFPDGVLVEELESFQYEYTATGVRYCLDPAVRVLTADLQWVPIGEVTTGTQLLAFDEHVTGGRNRRWQVSTVTESGRITRPCYEISLDDGTVIVASAEHQWLVDTGPGGIAWRTTEQLRAPHPTSRSLRFSPSRLVRLLPTWETDCSRGGGYLAAAFDGEGSLTQRARADREHGYSFRVSFAQRDNEMAAVVRRELTERGFEWHETPNRSGVLQFGLNGREAGKLRFLGEIRPHRLLSKFDPALLGAAYKIATPAVRGLKFIGDHEVVAVGTSTKTLLAEGLASHNSAPPGLHDDCVCALALAVHAWRQRSGFAAAPDVSMTRQSPWAM